MSDFANCPACHGRGVIPLAEAQRIETHDQVSRDAARQAQREREAEGQRLTRERITAAAEQRMAEIEAVLSDSHKTRQERHERQQQAAASGLQHTPEQLAALHTRLARLEAERAAAPT